jgi:F-type H+-transporting ATPase subunit epsilon
MFLEIVTPEASIFQGEVESVTVPGVDGQFQMLNNHAPIVSLLQEGNIKIQGDLSFDETYQDMFKTVDKTTSVLPIESGTIELNDNKIIILVD